MKKLLVLLLAVSLMLCTALALFSCGDEPCTEHKDENSDGTCDVCGAEVETKTPDKAELIKDGKVAFKIVLPKDISSAVKAKVEEDIVKVLEKLDADVEIVDDVADTATACEVIINYAASRGDVYNVDYHYLGSKGYAVKVVGSKVMIMAGSDKTMDDAIKYFVKEILGISGKTKTLSDVTMTAEMNFEEIQSGYAVTAVTVSGNALKDYVIAVNSSVSKDYAIATQIQTLIYEKTGIWLKLESLTTAASKKFVIKTVEEACDAGFSVVADNGNIVMECEFPEKFEDAALTFVRTVITNASGAVNLDKALPYTKDVRRIYYREFGAKGDGKTDDFIPIRNCHTYANDHGHTVCADPGYTFYIGDAPIRLSKDEQRYIIVMTDTEWGGAKFIFDDAKVPVEFNYTTHVKDGVDVTYQNFPDAKDKDVTCDRCLKKIHELKTGCTPVSGGWHSLPIFSIESPYTEKNITSTFAGASAKRGDPKLTLADGSVYAPGKTMLLMITDNSHRHYIRLGANENNGGDQCEIILVHPDGTIDKDTPLHWDYSQFSYVKAKCVDDNPISVGGTKEDPCTITTMANQGPNYYYSYGRNISTDRSNTTVQNVIHLIEGEGLPGKGKCPQGGFTSTGFSNNVTYDGIVFTTHKSHKDASNGTGMGSYEIHAAYANKVSWINCGQTNFFLPDGSMKYKGFFGTNYCKNFYVDNSVLESFDAHCGTYNATFKNSQFEHINCVGEGLIYMENVTVYTDGAKTAVHLRSDYGNTWRGEMFAKDIYLKSSTKEGNGHAISLISTSSSANAWNNHFFGYTCYLPEKITIDNINVIKYSYAMVNGERVETEVSRNEEPLYISEPLNKYKDFDISDPNAIITDPMYYNDWRQCKCSATNPPRSGKPYFNDTDGDGRCNNTIISEANVGSTVWCWGFVDAPDPQKNVNPYMPPENIYVYNCEDLKIIVPPTPQFSRTNVYVDDVLVGFNSTTGVVNKKED